MSEAATSQSHYPLDNYELADRYRRESGRVLLTGTQALVRIPLMQRTLDKARGLNTAGFVSGYRGSPLGMVDQELWRAKRFLDENQIEFLPAVNEDLAATAILGTQQVETDSGREPSTASSASGTARDPASIAPATRSSTATPTAVRRTAAYSLSPATITAAYRRRCRTSPTSRS